MFNVAQVHLSPCVLQSGLKLQRKFYLSTDVIVILIVHYLSYIYLETSILFITFISRINELWISSIVYLSYLLWLHYWPNYGHFVQQNCSCWIFDIRYDPFRNVIFHRLVKYLNIHYKLNSKPRYFKELKWSCV